MDRDRCGWRIDDSKMVVDTEGHLTKIFCGAPAIRAYMRILDGESALLFRCEDHRIENVQRDISWLKVIEISLEEAVIYEVMKI